VTTLETEPVIGQKLGFLAAKTLSITAEKRDIVCPVLDRKNLPVVVEPVVIHIVFVVSGISALLYQLVWQRSLLMLYGSNTESVAMVVTAFMVGLGLGSLAGGRVSKRERAPLVLLFSGTELFIGIYGAISLNLFHWVGLSTAAAGTIQTGLLAFALVFVPTFLMGATLPILVAYRVKSTGNVGSSISSLYFVNTLGGGLGALLAGFLLLGIFGLNRATQFAAMLNVVCSLAVLVTWKLRQLKS
jgi:predicted membrane-bound spermidine synthase